MQAAYEQSVLHFPLVSLLCLTSDTMGDKRINKNCSNGGSKMYHPNSLSVSLKQRTHSPTGLYRMCPLQICFNCFYKEILTFTAGEHTFAHFKDNIHTWVLYCILLTLIRVVVGLKKIQIGQDTEEILDRLLPLTVYRTIQPMVATTRLMYRVNHTPQLTPVGNVEWPLNLTNTSVHYDRKPKSEQMQ